MGIKVLIVDDEKLERVLIRKGYNWEENGFEIVGEVSSGPEALECMRVYTPDIVLTDINMPNMNGLEFIGKALEEFKDRNVKFIIITGYRDFEYARQAVKLGVEDFLLKPINIKSLNDIVTKLKEEIEKFEEERKEVNQLKESLDRNKNIVRESFLQRLVENRVSEQEALNKLKMYGYESLLDRCICCSIRLEHKQEIEDENKLNYSKRVMDLITEIDLKPTAAFIHYLGNVILYFSSVNYELLQSKMDLLENEINALLLMPVNIGISSILSGFEGIHKAYREAEKALNARMIIGQNRCILYEDYLKYKKTVNLADMDWDDFIFSVENSVDKKVQDYVKSYMMRIKESGNTDLQWLKFMTVNILTKAELTLHKKGKSLSNLKELKNFSEQVDSIDSIQQMEEVVMNSLQGIMDFHKASKPKKGKQVIKQALEVINKHLYDPEMSLSFVASKIYTNDSYLSRVFKQEMKESLINYITKKRIEESIRLLNTTDLKVYEIAERVGITNPHYFSICFKKQVGVTIKEYRKQTTGDGSK